VEEERKAVVKGQHEELTIPHLPQRGLGGGGRFKILAVLEREALLYPDLKKETGNGTPNRFSWVVWMLV